MKLHFLGPLSTDGSFADVWRAKDDLDRELAVKIVRDSAIYVSDALAHAQALARAKHPNVVTVHAIEKVNDPNRGGVEVDAVVMELLLGVTMEIRLKGLPLAMDELTRIGGGMLAGVRHIHSQGMVHGDLHVDNVMITDGDVKLIDILHRYTLSTATDERRAEAKRREVSNLAGLLQRLLNHSEIDAQQCQIFLEATRLATTLGELEEAFTAATSLAPSVRLRLEHPRTPTNLLDIVVPAMHRDRVRELLGSPSFVEANHWVYRYRETQVEISFNDSSAVEYLVIVLCAGKKYHGSHPTAHTDQPLGDMTLADVIEEVHDPLEVEYFESLRTEEVFVKGRWGPPGAWSYYACGALKVLSGVGWLEDVDFDWDKSSESLRSDPRTTKINWMAATSFASQPTSFNWYIKGP